MITGGGEKNEKLDNEDAIDKFLENEMTENKKQPWSKLSKILKNNKIDEYVDKYKLEHSDLNLTEDELTNTKIYLKKMIETKKLAKVKDIQYDKEEGTIVKIPNLEFNKQVRKFTIKSEKRVSTLKSLAPKNKATRKINTQKTSPKDKNTAKTKGKDKNKKKGEK